jgi:hypothetical protein
MEQLTLLSLASRQIWPQVLSVFNVLPSRLILFHSAEEAESKRPAERLKAFFEAPDSPHPMSVELRSIPHDRFGGIVDGMAGAAEEHGLDESNCRVNITGGNKLMAIAASEWCRLAGIPFFYLERDLRVFPFVPQGTDLLPQPDFKLNPHLAKDLDPLALLRCQLDAAEITSPGQRLELNERGQAAPENQFQILLKKGFDFRTYLSMDVQEPDSRAGDGLEYATAFALLKLGVPFVQRSVRLIPRAQGGSGREEGELDLVFNWAGKLWLVDCKDRKDAGSRMDKLRTLIIGQIGLTPQIEEHLEKLSSELRERDLKPLKEDLLAISEVAGLLGRVICVRREQLPSQAVEFARSRGLAVILKDYLLRDLRPLLHPDSPASSDQLRALLTARTRATT